MSSPSGPTINPFPKPRPVPASLRSVLSDALTHAVTNWKSSVQGVLTVAIAAGTYFTVTPSNVLSQKTVGVITLVTGLAKVMLGLTQKD